MFGRALLVLGFGGLLFVGIFQWGMWWQRERVYAAPTVTVGCARAKSDFGSFAYLWHADKLLRAVRVAEGVPSYGVVYLAKRYGSHQAVPPAEGRAAAAKIVHATYRAWVQADCPEPFLRFLHEVYAPPEAHPLNGHWLANTARSLAMQMVADYR